MANTPKLLAQTTLTDGGPDTVYTAPGSTTTLITYVGITNKHAGSARTVDIDAGDSGSEKKWRDDAEIAAKETMEFNGTFILETADVLKMTCANGTDLDVFVCGIEVT